jgi:hypothetical protein
MISGAIYALNNENIKQKKKRKINLVPTFIVDNFCESNDSSLETP